MALPPHWFSRKFSFDFDAALYPNILLRLRGAPLRLRELCAGTAPELLAQASPLPPEQLDGRSEGRWSILQHAGHLAVLDALWEQRVQDYLAGAEELSAADLQNRVTDEADFNALPLEEVLTEFDRARASLLARLEGLGPADYARTALHPRLRTAMRLVDGLYFSAEHDDHHLAWIWEIIHSAGAQSRLWPAPE